MKWTKMFTICQTQGDQKILVKSTKQAPTDFNTKVKSDIIKI